MVSLQDKKVLLIGVGGVGSHVAVALCRTGIGQLEIVDFDVVDESNLGRQYYDVNDVGVLKVEAMKGHLNRMNPNCEVIVHNECLTPERLSELIDGYDMVVEAVDKAVTKAWMTEVILTHPAEPLLVGCSGMAGWGDSNGIRRERRHHRWYLCGDGVSDIDSIGKITAARVMVCAGHMANAVIQLLHGEDID